MTFRDRTEAGRLLSQRLRAFDGDDLVVLALPRGGVPVAAEVAGALGAPMDVVIVRKVGLPQQPELAMGALGEDGTVVWNDDVLRRAGVSADSRRTALVRAREEIECRATTLRGDGVRPVACTGRTAIVVDDGVATGATMTAACRLLRSAGAARVVVAVPVAAPDAVRALRQEADDVICLRTPTSFTSVGQWYDDFPQLTDADVTRVLDAYAPLRRPAVRSALGVEVVMDACGVPLRGELARPSAARGLVVIGHAGSADRETPRNRAVAAGLVESGFATLLLDLVPDLSAGRADDSEAGVDAGLLGERFTAAVSWSRREPSVAALPVGLLGGSIAAAGALWAAGAADTQVTAVVCRGGRIDLARPRLPWVAAPTLLVVGARDGYVLDINRRVQPLLRCPNELRVVPGAGHLFDQPGTLSAVAAHAREWFTMHLRHVPMDAASSSGPSAVLLG